MKVQLCKAHWDLLSHAVAAQIYYQRPQADVMHFSGLDEFIPPNADCQPQTHTAASFYSANCSVTLATFIEMADNVQKHKADLNS